MPPGIGFGQPGQGIFFPSSSPATDLHPRGTAYLRTVLVDSPSAYFRLGETAGNYIDTMGGNSGIITGSLTRGVTGAIDASQGDLAVTLPGTAGNYISVVDEAALDLGDGPFSIELWVIHASSASAQTILQKAVNAYGIAISGGSNKLSLFKAGVGSVMDESGTTADSNWHHFVFTKNGTLRAIYKDGVNVTTLGTNQTLVDTASDLQIGRYADGSEPFNGSVDEVAFYKYVLAPDQIAAHYNAASVVVPPVEVSINAVAEAASGTGTASDTSISIAPTETAASGTGTSNQAVANIQPNAAAGAGTGTANNASGTSSASIQAASGTGTAANAASNIQPNSGASSGTGSAGSATASIAGNSGSAGGTGAAGGTSSAVAASAQSASGTGSATIPSITTSAATNATSEAASGTGTAANPAASIAGNAGSGSGTGAAGSTTSKVAASANAASGTGTANNPTVTTGAAATSVNAQAASGTGTANSATVTAISAAAGPPHHGPALFERIVPRQKIAKQRLPANVIAFAQAAHGRGQAANATTTWDDDEEAMALLLEAA